MHFLGCINDIFRNLTNLELTECISPWQWSLLRQEQMGPTHEPLHIQKFKVNGDNSCKDYLSHLMNTRTINEFFQNVSHGLFLNQCPGKYSLVPKERHVRKERNGGTLGLCVVPKESHDCRVSLT